jgi:hypothetical protein
MAGARLFLLLRYFAAANFTRYRQPRQTGYYYQSVSAWKRGKSLDDAMTGSDMKLNPVHETGAESRAAFFVAFSAMMA